MKRSLRMREMSRKIGIIRRTLRISSKRKRWKMTNLRKTRLKMSQ